MGWEEIPDWQHPYGKEIFPSGVWNFGNPQFVGMAPGIEGAAFKFEKTVKIKFNLCG